MAPDELNAPLGRNKRKKRRTLPISAPQLLAGILGLCGLVVVGWALFANDPLGGQPVAVVSAPTAGTAARSGGAGDQHGAEAATKAAAAKAAVPPPGSHTITIIDGSSGKRQDVIIPGNATAPAPSTGNPLVDKRLLEKTHDGSIPRIAPDGTRSFTRYASAVDIPANRRDAPRIAIVIGGLGIGAAATAEALSKLPAPVTFALAPYGSDLANLAMRARSAGHELLLQVPMEPIDYPDNDPGPSTLLTTLPPAQNLARLHWLMSRFEGYVGLASYMGGRFTQSDAAMAPVLHEASKRGLLYVDDGSSPRSAARQIAGSLNLPFAGADIVLDAVPTETEIDHALARLEMAARDHGSAVGYASAQPGAIARIARWAKSVESRGFVLVPITMIAVKSKSS